MRPWKRRRLKGLPLQPVQIEAIKWSFASQFIGQASLQEDKEGNKTLKGQSGMEKSLDRILAGQNGVITYDKDRNGNIVPGSDKVSVKTEDGKDVYTTISAELQTYLETRMDVFQEK